MKYHSLLIYISISIFFAFNSSTIAKVLFLIHVTSSVFFHFLVVGGGAGHGDGGICVFIDRGFCPTRPHSCSVPKKSTEVYINYQCIGLLAQASY